MQVTYHDQYTILILLMRITTLYGRYPPNLNRCGDGGGSAAPSSNGGGLYANNDPSSSLDRSNSPSYNTYQVHNQKSYDPDPLYDTNRQIANSNRYSSSNEGNKRSLMFGNDDEGVEEVVEKRQVGVVYGNGKPIGILQPYEESYKFIPVKEDNANSNGIGKREAATQGGRPAASSLQDEYPSILANFKINTRLDSKYLFHHKRAAAEVPRVLRTVASKTDKIEEKLEGILDDMGLTQESDSRTANEKRTEADAQAQLDKREDRTEDEGDGTEEDDGEDRRKKRRRRRRRKRRNNNNNNHNSNDNAIEYQNLLQQQDDDSLDVVKANGEVENPIEARDTDYEEGAADDSVVDYDSKRVEKEIKDKIDSLQAEVKREIDDMTNDKRRKRNVNMTLLDANDSGVGINPIQAIDPSDLKPLVRRKRHLSDDTKTLDTCTKRIAMTSRRQRTILNPYGGNTVIQDENGNLFEIDDEDGTEQLSALKAKRQDESNEAEQDVEEIPLLVRPERNLFVYDDEMRFRRPAANIRFASDYYYDADDDDVGAERLKRQEFDYDTNLHGAHHRFSNKQPHTVMRQIGDVDVDTLQRARRRVEEPVASSMDDTVKTKEVEQRLDEMSDVELFGPNTNYNGELSRYKRV